MTAISLPVAPPSPKSLRHALVVMLAIGMVLPSLLLLAATIFNTNTYERPRLLKATMEQYASLMSPALSQMLWNVDHASAQQLLENLVSHSSIVWIKIYKDDGKLWLEVTQDANGREPALQAAHKLVYDHDYLGEYVIAISDDPLRQNLWQSMQRQGLMLVLQLLVAISLVTGFFNGRVFVPLKTLGEAARKMQSGLLDQPVPVLREDEIGTLAQRVEQMRQALNQSFAEISALNYELEKRVEQRTAELALANAELEQTITHLNTAQDELVKNAKLVALGSLVAGISHELNTPIGNGLTAATTLQAQANAFSKLIDQPLRKSELAFYLNSFHEGSQIIYTAMRSASELIRQLKQLAVDQTSSRRRVFSLHETVNEVSTSLQPQLRLIPHRLVVHVPEGIRLDSFPGPLAQVLLNLINNALQHAFDNKDQGVMTLAAQETVTGVELVFSDDGCGIADENLPRIFDPFFTTRLGQGGSGLGLNIVYNLVTGMLGGSIEAESQPGKGARFIIYLPKKAPD